MTDSLVEQGLPPEEKRKPEAKHPFPVRNQPATTPPPVDAAASTIATIRNELTRKTKRNIYKGDQGVSSDNRDTSAYMIDLNGYSDEKRPKIEIDEVLTSALEAAIANGRDEVVIFDFGCGKGEFFKDIIADSVTGKRFKAT